MSSLPSSSPRVKRLRATVHELTDTFDKEIADHLSSWNYEHFAKMRDLIEDLNEQLTPSPAPVQPSMMLKKAMLLLKGDVKTYIHDHVELEECVQDFDEAMRWLDVVQELFDLKEELSAKETPPKKMRTLSTQTQTQTEPSTIILPEPPKQVLALQVRWEKFHTLLRSTFARLDEQALLCSQIVLGLPPKDDETHRKVYAQGCQLFPLSPYDLREELAHCAEKEYDSVYRVMRNFSAGTHPLRCPLDCPFFNRRECEQHPSLPSLPTSPSCSTCDTQE